MTDNSNKNLEGKKRSLANLRPAKKGEVRNPYGRPSKEKCLTDLLMQRMNQVCPLPEANSREWREMIVDATLELASKGHPAALKEVWDRVDGKIVIPVDVKEEITQHIVYEATITDTGQVNTEATKLPSETISIHPGQGEVHTN